MDLQVKLLIQNVACWPITKAFPISVHSNHLYPIKINVCIYTEMQIMDPATMLQVYVKKSLLGIPDFSYENIHKRFFFHIFFALEILKVMIKCFTQCRNRIVFWETITLRAYPFVGLRIKKSFFVLAPAIAHKDSHKSSS